MQCKFIICGLHYNNALVAIESNYTMSPLKTLEKNKYPNLYVRIKEDDFTHQPIKKYGFETNKITRPIIIANLVELVREHVDIFNSTKLLEEMLTFIRNEKGRAEAQNGAHDDHVLAMCIAQYIRDFVVWDNESLRMYPIVTAKNFEEDEAVEDEFGGGFEIECMY